MSIVEKIAVLGALILIVLAVRIIYEIKNAPTVGEDYARKIEKAEEESDRY